MGCYELRPVRSQKAIKVYIIIRGCMGRATRNWPQPRPDKRQWQEWREAFGWIQIRSVLLWREGKCNSKFNWRNDSSPSTFLLLQIPWKESRQQH